MDVIVYKFNLCYNIREGDDRMHYEVTHHTDVGIRKDINQDSLCTVIANSSYGEICLVVLCDGMGGIQLGEVASGLTVYRIRNWFREKFPELLREHGINFEIFQELLNLEICTIDQEIRNYARQQQVKMGTTLTLALLIGQEYLIAQLGDSRAYLLSDDIQMLTEDQSYVYREYLRGHITMEQARVHPKRNLLLQCIGGSREAMPVFSYGKLNWNDRILLCTDGFVHENSDEEIYANLSSYSALDQQILHDAIVFLVEKAKKQGERDNISALAVSIKKK